MVTRGLQKDEEGKGCLEPNWQAHILSLEARARCRCKETLRTFFPWTFDLILQRPSQASQPQRKQFLVANLFVNITDVWFLCRGPMQSSWTKTQKEWRLFALHSFTCHQKIDKFAKMWTVQNQSLKLISTIQIIYWKLAAIIAKSWRWGFGRRGSDNDDSMIHQTSPRKTSLT